MNAKRNSNDRPQLIKCRFRASKLKGIAITFHSFSLGINPTPSALPARTGGHIGTLASKARLRVEPANVISPKQTFNIHKL